MLGVQGFCRAWPRRWLGFGVLKLGFEDLAGGPARGSSEEGVGGGDLPLRKVLTLRPKGRRICSETASICPSKATPETPFWCLLDPWGLSGEVPEATLGQGCYINIYIYIYIYIYNYIYIYIYTCCVCWVSIHISII